MNVNDLGSSTPVKLVRVLNALVEHHGIRLDFTKSNFDQLMETYDACAAVKFRIVESAAHNSYHTNDKYREAALIQEAIHIFLSEVAPKRLNRRQNHKQALGANNE
jgi:hypothetical protein